MEAEVKFISVEVIRPSSPTPHHLREFPISLLDQLTPPFYTPIILYYHINGQIHESKTEDGLSSRLKRSLSRALANFYPLAGRLRNNRYIECNDEGVPYFKTRVTNCDLSGFLKQPKLESLDMLLPCHTICRVPEEEAAQVCVQVNTFPCGGLAIGISLLHKIIDGTLISQFLKKWASFSRMPGEILGHNGLAGEDKCSKLCYAPASVLFPRRDALPSNAIMWVGSPSGGEVRSSAGRYVFNAEVVATIKKKCASKSVSNPTAVEALSGFIWMCLMKASRVKSGSQKPAVLAHAMNIRRRMAPPLADWSIGNIVWKAFACYKPDLDREDHKPELPNLVSLLRRSISKINASYIEKLKGEDEGFREISKWLEEVGRKYSDGEPEAYSFTSWCKMGFNEVDFGWGGPVWVSPGFVVDAPFKNGVLLMEANRGNKGEVEAWVILDEKEMEILEQDQEFLDFVSINPSVLPLD